MSWKKLCPASIEDDSGGPPRGKRAAVMPRDAAPRRWRCGSLLEPPPPPPPSSRQLQCEVEPIGPGPARTSGHCAHAAGGGTGVAPGPSQAPGARR